LVRFGFGRREAWTGAAGRILLAAAGQFRWQRQARILRQLR
jgi:hypothetical protein